MRIIPALLSTVFLCMTYPAPCMQQPFVIASNFDVLSHNAQTSNIISKALSSAGHILSCFYWSHIAPWRLCSTIAHMQQRGIELAKTTPGITNTIKKLFNELERDQYGTFSTAAISCFNEMGVNPIPDQDSVSLMHTIKSFNIPTIGMGTQDSLEHEIYARKMLQEHSIDIHRLFDGIITIPTLEEHVAFDASQASYFTRNPTNPRWFVCRDIGETPAKTHTLKMLARDLAGNVPIWPIETKEQLALVTKALIKVYEQRPLSPEPDKAFSELIYQHPCSPAPITAW